MNGGDKPLASHRRGPRPPARSDRALLLRMAPYGESDAVVTLLTEREGIVPAIAKRARVSSPRRKLLIEPFHTLLVELAAGSGELSALRTSTIDVARGALLDDGARLDAAGLATRWARTLSPPRHPEPEVFAALERLLDRLACAAPIERALADFGLVLLEALGYGLEFGACARCARPRPAGKAAFVQGREGGVICETCRGGASRQDAALPGELLDLLARRGREPLARATLDEAEQRRLLAIVRDAIELRARAVGAREGAR